MGDGEQLGFSPLSAAAALSAGLQSQGTGLIDVGGGFKIAERPLARSARSAGAALGASLQVTAAEQAEKRRQVEIERREERVFARQQLFAGQQFERQKQLSALGAEQGAAAFEKRFGLAELAAKKKFERDAPFRSAGEARSERLLQLRVEAGQLAERALTTQGEQQIFIRNSIAEDREVKRLATKEQIEGAKVKRRILELELKALENPALRDAFAGAKSPADILGIALKEMSPAQNKRFRELLVEAQSEGDLFIEDKAALAIGIIKGAAKPTQSDIESQLKEKSSARKKRLGTFGGEL